MFRSHVHAHAYTYLLPYIAKVAREKGYAIAVHGSMQRDLDIIAAPWTDEAVPAEELINAIIDEIGGFSNTIADQPTMKPHGRKAWSLYLTHCFGPYLDISVMPRSKV